MKCHRPGWERGGGWWSSDGSFRAKKKEGKRGLREERTRGFKIRWGNLWETGIKKSPKKTKGDGLLLRGGYCQVVGGRRQSLGLAQRQTRDSQLCTDLRNVRQLTCGAFLERGEGGVVEGEANDFASIQ